MLTAGSADRNRSLFEVLLRLLLNSEFAHIQVNFKKGVEILSLSRGETRVHQGRSTRMHCRQGIGQIAATQRSGNDA